MPGWNQGAPARQPQVEANLADRFSRGEITADEYRTGIDVLRGRLPGQPQPQAQYRPAGPGPAAPAQPEPPAAPADPMV